ncbi:hypothetical protein [Natrinema sp. 74]|uniref:hypothetical protein n=1 Tax=Natrinema sp. 74 TaxID=3384159 RepID=UPI0038D48E2A
MLPPLRYDVTGGVTVEGVGDAAVLREVLASVLDGIDVSVERVGEYDAAREPVDAALTSRQRDAIAIRQIAPPCLVVAVRRRSRHRDRIDIGVRSAAVPALAGVTDKRPLGGGRDET